MRSRYTAFARNAIDYLVQTHDPQTIGDLDRADLADFAARARWLGLTVHGAQVTAEGARVQFTAAFEADGAARAIDEDSRFRQLADGRWVYVDGRPRT
jgi:SEC-C motif-containing protein